MRFSRKSNKPFNAGASTLYFLYCYIFTGMLFCVFWGASFLFADALTTGANACGPYKSAAAAAFDTLKTEASADADVFKVLFDFFLEPRYGTRLGRGASRTRTAPQPIPLHLTTAGTCGPRSSPSTSSPPCAARAPSCSPSSSRCSRERRPALSLPRLTTPLLSRLQVQTQANLSTTALLQQRLRKVEKERDVARKIEGRIRQEIRRRETQESVADDAGWKSGGEG